MLVQRQIVSATVHAGLNQEQVSGTGISYAPATSCNREICNALVEVGQPIKALRPWTRQVVSKPQVRRQLASYFPGVPDIESPIVFLPSNRARDIYGARCLVAQGGANAKAIAQNEVGKILPGPRRPKTLRRILSPEPIEGNKPSSCVGLQIVVVCKFKLRTSDDGVLSVDSSHARGEVVLCVFVRDRTLSLAASNERVGDAETGREGSSLYVGDGSIVRRWITLLGNIEPGIDRYAEVAKTASADVDVHRRCRSQRVIVTDGKGVGVIRLSAAILAQARAERIAWQVFQPPITVAAKNTALRT